MAAPNASQIVTNPPPLNPTVFPYRVDEFPAKWLNDFGSLLPMSATEELVQHSDNPNRLQD